jgi:hypothetical protein
LFPLIIEGTTTAAIITVNKMKTAPPPQSPTHKWRCFCVHQRKIKREYVSVSSRIEKKKSLTETIWIPQNPVYDTIITTTFSLNVPFIIIVVIIIILFISLLLVFVQKLRTLEFNKKEWRYERSNKTFGNKTYHLI